MNSFSWTLMVLIFKIPLLNSTLMLMQNIQIDLHEKCIHCNLLFPENISQCESSEWEQWTHLGPKDNLKRNIDKSWNRTVESTRLAKLEITKEGAEKLSNGQGGTLLNLCSKQGNCERWRWWAVRASRPACPWWGRWRRTRRPPTRMPSRCLSVRFPALWRRWILSACSPSEVYEYWKFFFIFLLKVAETKCHENWKWAKHTFFIQHIKKTVLQFFSIQERLKWKIWRAV